MFSTSINMNGIVFNIYCNDKKYIDKVNKLFNKMMTNDNSVILPRDSINIYVINDSKEYYKRHERLKLFKEKKLKPNISEYTVIDKNIYHNNDFISYLYNGDYYIISNESKYSPYYLLLEIYQKTCEANGYYIFHGNGLTIDNESYNIIGNSHSGKTTLMSKLFQIDGLPKEFLSNDRILVGSEQTLYFPIDINLDKHTIEHDKYLSKNFQIDKEKEYVHPNSFISCYPNMDYISNTTNSNVIIPRIDLVDKHNLAVYPADENSLLECCFSIEDKECLRDDWIIKGKSKNEKTSEAKSIINSLLDNYNIMCLQYGADLSGEEIYERIRKKN